jgi:hypothetical protein
MVNEQLSTRAGGNAASEASAVFQQMLNKLSQNSMGNAQNGHY